MADRRLHIGVDGRELADRPTGVGRYVREVLKVWSTDAELGKRIRVTVFTTGATGTIGTLGTIGTTGATIDWVIDERAGSGTWWEQRRLPTLVARAGVDVLLAPAYTAPMILACPFVVVIHDVSFFAHPEWFSFREGWRRRLVTRASARRAHRIVTVSEFSAAEIVRFLGVPRERIVLASPAAAPPAARPVAPAEREPPPTQTVLYAGSLFNRRNIPLLIEGFAQTARAQPGARLVMVGDNRTSPRIDPRAVADAHGIGDRVTWHDYVNDDALEQLYRSARVFAFLSDYEGFGIPPMEALARGVPPVLLDTPVSREIYGEAASRAGRSASAVAAALSTLLLDDALRERRLRHGADLLARFTWARTAAMLARTLEEAVSR